MQLDSQFDERVVRAAEAVLAERHYVTLVDLLMSLGFLAPSAYDRWRLGREPYLEPLLHVGAAKLARTKDMFQTWAEKRQLKRERTAYHAQALSPRRDLTFREDGSPELADLYRTCYLSSELSGSQAAKIVEKLGRAPELAVFSIVKESHCVRCNAALPEGSLLAMDGTDPLCLRCAGLDHLVYLSRGDAGLTRRTTKYSSISAKVLRYSRTRKRYERQGILVEEAALKRAEQELGLQAEAV